MFRQNDVIDPIFCSWVLCRPALAQMINETPVMLLQTVLVGSTRSGIVRRIVTDETGSLIIYLKNQIQNISVAANS